MEVFKEIIQEENGLPFKLNQIEEAIIIIETIIDNHSERDLFVKNECSKVNEIYSSEKVVDEYLTVLREIEDRHLLLY